MITWFKRTPVYNGQIPSVPWVSGIHSFSCTSHHIDMGKGVNTLTAREILGRKLNLSPFITSSGFKIALVSASPNWNFMKNLVCRQYMRGLVTHVEKLLCLDNIRRGWRSPTVVISCMRFPWAIIDYVAFIRFVQKKNGNPKNIFLLWLFLW